MGGSARGVGCGWLDAWLPPLSQSIDTSMVQPHWDDAAQCSQRRRPLLLTSTLLPSPTSPASPPTLYTHPSPARVTSRAHREDCRDQATSTADHHLSLHGVTHSRRPRPPTSSTARHGVRLAARLESECHVQVSRVPARFAAHARGGALWPHLAQFQPAPHTATTTAERPRILVGQVAAAPGLAICAYEWRSARLGDQTWETEEPERGPEDGADTEGER
jgi:hypothetical protein